MQSEEARLCKWGKSSSEVKWLFEPYDGIFPFGAGPVSNGVDILRELPSSWCILKDGTISRLFSHEAQFPILLLFTCFVENETALDKVLYLITTETDGRPVRECILRILGDSFGSTMVLPCGHKLDMGCAGTYGIETIIQRIRYMAENGQHATLVNRSPSAVRQVVDSILTQTPFCTVSDMYVLGRSWFYVACCYATLDLIKATLDVPCAVEKEALRTLLSLLHLVIPFCSYAVLIGAASPNASIYRAAAEPPNYSTRRLLDINLSLGNSGKLQVDNTIDAATGIIKAAMKLSRSAVIAGHRPKKVKRIVDDARVTLSGVSSHSWDIVTCALTKGGTKQGMHEAHAALAPESVWAGSVNGERR